ALIYSTYLGGSGDDDGRVFLDSAGNVYMVGATSSINFPTVNPLQSANAGGFDAFIAKIADPSVIATIGVGSSPAAVGVNPNTNRIYVANTNNNNVSVIDGSTNSVIATVAVGSVPIGVGVNPNTNRIYVANINNNTVSVIDGGTNSVIATVAV